METYKKLYENNIPQELPSWVQESIDKHGTIVKDWYYHHSDRKFVFKDGIWKGGVWLNGTWLKGTWENGIWEDGTWCSGTWEDGIWKKGMWINGIWYGGTWLDGVWNYGTWLGGIWKKGIILDINKVGNFQLHWNWDNDFVRSSISPKYYFAKK